MAKDKFSSKIGYLLALVGAAVGLGNMWRFPYLLGTNGGAAFLIIYLAIVFIVCFPIIIAEFYLGVRFKSSAIKTISAASGNRRFGQFAGVVMFLSCFCAIAFYIVVGGWIIRYCLACFDFTDVFLIGDVDSFMSSVMAETDDLWSWEALKAVVSAVAFLFICSTIIRLGVGKGIELFSKITMPFLFITVLILAIYASFLPGASEGFRYLFYPDFSKITGGTFANALGQACMSLCIGSGMVLTYAAYASHTKEKTNQIKIGAQTIIADTFFALLAGLAIIPAVFAFHESPGQGPELVFSALPKVFAQMEFGNIIAPVFFFSLITAAISSGIAILEMMIAVLIESGSLTRQKAVSITNVIVVVVGTLCALSFGPLKHVQIFGLSIFDTFDFASSDLFMTLGAFFIVLTVGWMCPKDDFVKTISQGDARYEGFTRYLHFIIRWVAPAVIVLVMILGFIR